MAEQKAGGWSTPYKYTGKELDDEIGMYDYGARFYDPSISLWTSVDPWVESYTYHTPYNYTANNPIRFIDPNGKGLDDWFKNRRTGERVWFDKTNDSFEAGGDTWENSGKGGFSTVSSDGTQTNYHDDGSFDNKTTGSTLQGPTVTPPKDVFSASIMGFKLEYSGSITGKVEGGLIKIKDQGIEGYTIKGLTIDLLEFKHDSKNGFSGYYVGKGGKFKGSGPSFQIESPLGDFKAGSKWSITPGPLGPRPVVNGEFGVGAPGFEAKFTKKALLIGIQEDIGGSKGFLGILGVGYKFDFRMQLKITKE